jgi:hypothetical protein
MRPPSTPFFRDVAWPSHRQDRVAYERFQMDTLAERKTKARPSTWPRIARALGFSRKA